MKLGRRVRKSLGARRVVKVRAMASTKGANGKTRTAKRSVSLKAKRR